MTTPSWQQWRVNSSAGNGLQVNTVKERQLAALACLVSGTNPDGTARGT